MLPGIASLLPSIGTARDVGIGVVVVLVLGALSFGLVRYHVQGERLESSRARTNALAADTARLGQQIRTMRGQIVQQNDSLQALRQRARHLEARLVRARRRSDSLRSRAEREAGRLLAVPVPADCRRAVRWGATIADSLSRSWTP